MSTQTSNLNLVKQANNENWSNDIHNANLQKIDDAYPPRRPVYKSISVTSQSALDSAIAEECASLAYGNFEVIELYGNWTGSPTNGARSLATIHRLNLSGAYYMCYVHYTGAVGYYYSNAWHWDMGFPAITSKTIYNGTANSNYISALEGKVVKNGSVVSGYFVLTANADFSAANLTLISNLPAAYNQDIQLPCIGLSETNIYKASRVKITTSGTMVTWYGFGFKSGESYLVPVNYICA